VLADESNTDVEYVSAVLSGNAVITPQFADALERIFGLQWSFWMGRDTRFDDAVQRYLRDSSSYLS
jgi:plasmid maintenance system antidote protein VapI